jgi:hypothetical protein
MFDQLAAFDATAVLGSGDRNQARHRDMVVGNTSLTTRQTRVVPQEGGPAVGSETSAYVLQRPTSPARYMTELSTIDAGVVPASNDIGVSSWKPQPIDDEYRCEGRDGMGRRCQLVVGHGGQHVLQAGGSRLTWPVGAEFTRGCRGR